MTEGKLGEAPAPPTAEAAGTAVPKQTVEETTLEDDPAELEEMQNRLSALRS